MQQNDSRPTAQAPPRDIVDEILNWHAISQYRGEIYGIVILWIMIFHVNELFPKIGPLKNTLGKILDHGMIGVDVFLFISGISLYFSLKKKSGTVSWLTFYKKRIQKIGLIYLTLCIPFFLYMYLIYSRNVPALLEQVTFTANTHSSFWFLFALLVCYLLYPIIFRFLEQHNNAGLIILYGGIFGGILLSLFFFPEFFVRYNISLGRYPVFLAGALCGPAVYHRRRIPVGFFMVMLVLLFVLTDGVVVALKAAGLYNDWGVYYLAIRLRMGLQGVGSVLFLLPFLPILSQGPVGRFLRYTGSITLELYVLHIISRRLLRGPLELHADSIVSKEIFLILMLLLSYVSAFAYTKLCGGIAKLFKKVRKG